jgi:hypothetical protein
VSVDLDALFDRHHTAFRLEQRGSYDVGGAEADRIHAFQHGLPRPERSVRTNPWLARVARTTAAGARWRRLRVVDEPLTEYQRYQLFGGTYVESQTAGDETLVVQRAIAGPWLRYAGGSAVVGDFWVLDQGEPTELVVALDYTNDGRFAGNRVVGDPAERAAMLAVATELVLDAAPLAEYLATLTGSSGTVADVVA